MAPMAVDVTEVVLTPAPEPHEEPEATRAGRYGGQGCDHWNGIGHPCGQSGQKIWQVA